MCVFSMLISKFDYPQENVKVLFHDGLDYHPIENNPGPYAPRYKKLKPEDPKITTASCTYADVKSTILNLGSNENDFVFIFVFTHGRYRNEFPPYQYGILCPQMILTDYMYTDTDYISPEEFTSLVAGIPAQKKVIWMQPCYSGGFKDYFTPYLSGSQIIVDYSCLANEEAWSADSYIKSTTTSELEVFDENEPAYFNQPPDYMGNWGSPIHHGEFAYHLYSCLAGQTPKILESNYNSDGVLIPLSGADNNPTDGVISEKESFNWANLYNSRQHYNDPTNQEHFDFQESWNGLSSKTSLKYPNIVSSINDLIVNSTSPGISNTGIYGITNSIVVTGSNKSLIFGPNSKIYLLNNAKIYIQGGATLSFQDGVEIYGNGQNSVRIENGTINLGQNGKTGHIDHPQAGVN